jgi:formylglycine-generating enzyme required for sulfatase activity
MENKFMKSHPCASQCCALALVVFVALGMLSNTHADAADAPFIDMARIPAGEFIMGAANGHASFLSFPARPVRVAEFELGRHQVTQAQWIAVMGERPRIYGEECGDDCPVVNVAYDDIQNFISRLNALTGERYRLPSEAEWEYACRTGGDGEHCWDGSPYQYVWHSGNSGGRRQPVARLLPNYHGVFDMGGNAMDIVEDCWEQDYRQGQPLDGRAHVPARGWCTMRVSRGCSSNCELNEIFVGTERGNAPVNAGEGYDGMGFRLAR